MSTTNQPALFDLPVPSGSGGNGRPPQAASGGGPAPARPPRGAWTPNGREAAPTAFPLAAAETAGDADPMAGLAPDWAEALAPVAGKIRSLLAELAAERDAGAGILPAPGNILRAFTRPLSGVKVLLLGQDPYPTPGHAVGLSFSVDAAVRPLPRSLGNIYRELKADLDIDPPAHGDLSAWADQGVLLMNRVLTVEAGNAGSHRGRGWEEITSLAVEAVASRKLADGSHAPLVAILWGRDAQSVVPLLHGAPRIESVHPSPLSASKGFFGSRPFSRTNMLLKAQGATPVDWRLEAVR